MGLLFEEKEVTKEEIQAAQTAVYKKAYEEWVESTVTATNLLKAWQKIGTNYSVEHGVAAMMKMHREVFSPSK